MPDLTIGQIVRLHAAVLGVLLATALPALVGNAHVPATDGGSITASLAVLVSAAWLRAYRTSK